MTSSHSPGFIPRKACSGVGEEKGHSATNAMASTKIIAHNSSRGKGGIATMEC
jgi:hypothetical protein